MQHKKKNIIEAGLGLVILLLFYLLIKNVYQIDGLQAEIELIENCRELQEILSGK